MPRRPPSQTCRTVLHNYVKTMVSVDFLPSCGRAPFRSSFRERQILREQTALFKQIADRFGLRLSDRARFEVELKPLKGQDTQNNTLDENWIRSGSSS
jgi:hypothetical protein